MRLPLKAALFSGLLIPGAGQFFLKRYISASCFIVLSIVAIAVIVVFAFNTANDIAEHIINKQFSVELSELVTLTRSKLTDRPESVRLASYGLIGLWFLSIIHAYWAAKNSEMSLVRDG